MASAAAECTCHPCYRVTIVTTRRRTFRNGGTGEASEIARRFYTNDEGRHLPAPLSSSPGSAARGRRWPPPFAAVIPSRGRLVPTRWRRRRSFIFYCSSGRFSRVDAVEPHSRGCRFVRYRVRCRANAAATVRSVVPLFSVCSRHSVFSRRRATAAIACFPPTAVSIRIVCVCVYL